MCQKYVCWTSSKSAVYRYTVESVGEFYVTAEWKQRTSIYPLEAHVFRSLRDHERWDSDRLYLMVAWRGIGTYCRGMDMASSAKFSYAAHKWYDRY